MSWTPLWSGEPTEQRVWTATNGKTVTGQALGIERGKVKLKRADARVVEVPLEVFIPADRKLLEEHFDSAVDAGEVETFGKKKLAKHAEKGNTPKGHVDPKIEKGATELADVYAGVPVIEATFRAFAGPTK